MIRHIATTGPIFMEQCQYINGQENLQFCLECLNRDELRLSVLLSWTMSTMDSSPDELDS